MDLNARVNVHFARVDVNFQTVSVTFFCYNFYSFSYELTSRVQLTLHTKSPPNILSHVGEMDLNVRVDVNCFKVDVNFQTVILT